MGEPLEGGSILGGWFQHATFSCRSDVLFRESQRAERGFNRFRGLVVAGRTVIGRRGRVLRGSSRWYRVYPECGRLNRTRFQLYLLVSPLSLVWRRDMAIGRLSGDRVGGYG